MWEENNSKQQWSIFGIKALYPKYKTTQAYKEHWHPSPTPKPIDTSIQKKTDNTPPFAINATKKDFINNYLNKEIRFYRLNKIS